MNQATVFQSIISPLLDLLKQEAKLIRNDDFKLSLYFFTLNLCYCVISNIPSIRQLVTEIKTAADASRLGLVDASSSMYSEAFSRYDPLIFKRLFFALLDRLQFKSIPEINTLGRCLVVDGSIFPAMANMAWASYKSEANALKLHLAFELNRMIPVQFISTNANASEKQVLIQLLESGVTYIADRGYISFDLFRQITEQAAFFCYPCQSEHGLFDSGNTLY